MSNYAGNDVYTSTGPLPDDLGPATGANVNPYLEMLADRATWLKNRTSDYRLVAEGLTAVADAGATNAIAQLGGNPVTISATSYSGDPAALPLVSGLTVKTNDYIEIELSGTLKSTLNLGGAWLRMIVGDGSVFEPQGAKEYIEAGARAIALNVKVDDGDAGAAGYPQPVKASWTVADWSGTPYLLQTISGLLEGDVVDVVGVLHMNVSSSSTGHSGMIRIETQENSSSNVAVDGARAYSADSANTGDSLAPRVVVFRHVMLADGTLKLYARGHVDAATDSATVFLIAPISMNITPNRYGSPARPFAMVGRYLIGNNSSSFQVGLDGKVSSGGATLSAIGSLVCKWRLMRSNS